MQDPTSKIINQLLAQEDMEGEDPQALVETLGLTPGEVEAIAALTGSVGYRTLVNVFRKRLDTQLGAIERETDEQALLQAVRLWQALRQALEDVEYFPDCCRRALQYTETRGDDPEED